MEKTPVNYIQIRGARQNNLKNLSIDLPLNKIIVITGVSGSGKSSLAFDTVYAEGQRRYVETFSSYARQFLDRMDRPAVDSIDGMPPAIAIDQTNPVRTSRSTVGTMTELNDHIKLLFARASFLVCKGCGKKVTKDSPASIYRKMADNMNGCSSCITFTITVPPNFAASEIEKLLGAQGYHRFLRHTDTSFEVIQDIVDITESNRERLVEDLEKALHFGKGQISVYKCTADRSAAEKAQYDTVNNASLLSVNELKFTKKDFVEIRRFSSGLHCPDCDIHYKEPIPGTFSFNSPVGACEACRGFGRIIDVDYDLVIPDKTKSLAQGCVKPWQTPSFSICQDELMEFTKKDGIPVNTPWEKLTEKQKNWVIEGVGEFDEKKWYGIKRFFKWLETKSYKLHIRVMLSKYRGYYECKACNGTRLKSEALNWRIGSGDGINIIDMMNMPICKLVTFFTELRLPHPVDEAAEIVLEQIRTRLRYLEDVGLGYLTLDRQSRTLSGGEVQRINLTTALGTSLVNTLFVLDEPSIGLHSRDIGRLTGVLKRLRDAGNSLIIVEHDPELISAADYVIDMGPGPGERGGEVVFYGSLHELYRQKTSVTAQYMSGKKSICCEGKSEAVDRKNVLRIKGAQEHNLKNVDVDIPLNRLVCVTGVSGSGKSTLIQDVCYNGLMKKLGKTSSEEPGRCKDITGYEKCSDVVLVDQAPIGKTTRSNPISYVGGFEIIRKIFADEELSKERGYTAGTFSFNSGTGRCPSCSGNGFEHVEMQFLSDVYLRCPECNGKRFRKEILEVRIKSASHPKMGTKSVSDVLDMTIEEACMFFSDRKSLLDSLEPLRQVGLSYMKLGQPLPTLSGGEAQRLKLAGHLAEKLSAKNRNILFMFDEPTTGLHFSDVKVLMDAFRVLVREGHSVVVIEHNLDVIKNSDWIIDIGPEGGDEGGEIVFCGTPEEIIKCKKSHTGYALANYNLTDKKETISHIVNELPAKSVIPSIEIRNAREHNLKNVDVMIPRDRFTVITGVSGSGKSTIAFDILFAEGQRRYLESLNAYARQFVEPVSKPDVDSVNGVPPTVAIEQRTSRGGRKSTVATVTEIYHFLRLLYVKVGTQFCPDCNIPIEPKSADTICAEIISAYPDKNVTVYSPLVKNRKGIYNDLAKWAYQNGFMNLRVDEELLSTENWPKIDRFREHSIDLPVAKLKIEKTNEKQIREIISKAIEYGKGSISVEVSGKGKKNHRLFSTLRSCPQCSRSFEEPDPVLFSFNSKHGWCPHCFGTGLEISGFDENQTGEEIQWNEWYDGTERECRSCHGKRLNREALSIKIDNRAISDFTNMPVETVLGELDKINLTERNTIVARDIINELRSRLQFLMYVGLDYLTLDRAAPTLSGGEAQRIRLASQLGSNLKGVCYILDEPTIGLHSRDNERLLNTMKLLKNKGNTVVVVEHDEDTIKSADYIIDVGPGGGKTGGEVIAAGTVREIIENKRSVTGWYLKNPIIHDRKRRPAADAQWLKIRKANLHNLKCVDVAIPLGRLVCVTGVSGSGKSTLVRDILLDNMIKKLEGSSGKTAGCSEIEGWNAVTRVLEVDQRPIGKTPRSCPSTYIGFWDDIRKLFAKTSESLMRGYDSGRFSFNVDKGRCPVCEGQGMKRIEMSFLPDVSVVCEECGGKRFTKETLEVQFREKNIFDILNMSVDEGVEFFAAHPSIHRALRLLQDVGLGYITLGQQSPTLSGGEAQRIKLVTELDKSTEYVKPVKTRKKAVKSNVLYILDEPTVGLHTSDIDRLLAVLHRLVDNGNSVVVIEHNLDVVAEADWVIDLGPEGGTKGGSIIAEGTPEHVAKSRNSYTGKYLHDILRRK